MLNAVTAEGFTALHFAAHRISDPSIIDALLENGANVNAKDRDGFTALQRCCRLEPSRSSYRGIDRRGRKSRCSHSRQRKRVALSRPTKSQPGNHQGIGTSGGGCQRSEWPTIDGVALSGPTKPWTQKSSRCWYRRERMSTPGMVNS